MWCYGHSATPIVVTSREIVRESMFEAVVIKGKGDGEGLELGVSGAYLIAQHSPYR